MIKGFFITGTGTGVGKTFVSCLLASQWSVKYRVGVMKPFASGTRLDAMRLRKYARRFDLTLDDINPIYFKKPLSPYSADGFPKKDQYFSRILGCYEKLKSFSNRILVEGIGGLHVPITQDLTVADLARGMSLPLIIVTGSGLGTLNHTLLTIHYAVQKGLKIVGLVVDRSRKTTDLSSRTNLDALRRLTGFPILGSIPYVRGRFDEKIRTALGKGYLNECFFR